MMKKGMFNKLLLVLVIISFVVCIQVPVVAQEGTLQDQLAEAKAAIADQTWVIEQLTDNFFKTTKELVKEINSLKAANAEQAEIIKKITENFFKITGELEVINAELEDKIAEQAETIKQITDNFFFKTELDSLATINAELEKKVAEQAETVEKLTGNFFKVTGELRSEIAGLQVVNDGLKIADEEHLATIKKLKTQRLLLGLGFIAAAYMACGH